MKYPLDRKSKTYLIAAHYLFDLHLSSMKVAHVLGVDVGYVDSVFNEESAYRQQRHSSPYRDRPCSSAWKRR